MKQVSRERVREIEGEDYRFHVPSDTFGQPPHLVDLESHRGRGECDCRDFVCHRNKLRKQGEKNLVLIQCKHIKRAFIVWARREIKRQLDQKRESQGGHED